MDTGIRRAMTPQTDAHAAIRELRGALAQPNLSLVLFFCSATYDFAALAAELNRIFPGVLVVGCTSAGQYGPGGWSQYGMAAVSFSGAVVTAVAGSHDDLACFTRADGHALAGRLQYELYTRLPSARAEHTFALLLTDGLSQREELVARSCKESLGSIRMFGGAAGDSLRAEQTMVFGNGRFRAGAAILLLAHSALPFRVFKTAHLAPTGERWVITQADPARRIVYEINGLPAADEFARLSGISAAELAPRHFAAASLAVTIGGQVYIRALQKVNPDKSVTFQCAIEEGVVLRVTEGRHLAENLRETLAQIAAQIGPPALLLNCDCVMRQMEIADKHLEQAVYPFLEHANALGFNTYGEIYDGIYLNQTLTGIAFGCPPQEADHG